MSPGGRTERHQAIVDVLSRHAVRSQSHLMQLLADRGITVTQATLSRDLVDLGAVKARDDEGPVYAVPQPASHVQDAAARLRRACADLLLSAEVSANLVVLRTPAAAANLLASAIDRGGAIDVLGTIAGDDTVLVIASSAQAASGVAEEFMSASEVGREGKAYD